MAEVKRGRGRPKKVQQEQVKQDVITKEDIEKALAEIVDEKMVEYGVAKKPEPQQSVDDVDMVAMMHAMLFEDNANMNTTPTLEWQSIFNVLTRIYESSDDEYNNVQYNSIKDNIVVMLDPKVYTSLDTELTRVKNAVCASSLKYEGYINETQMIITISKK